MGFAWKSTPKGEPVPDTEFGPDLEAAALNKDDSAPAPAREVVDDSLRAELDQHDELRLANIMGRKRGGDDDDGGSEARLPLIGHLSLPRQLRILLMVFVAGILVTVVALWRNAASSSDASAQTQIASDALMHSQRIGKAAPNAIQGNPEAFMQLDQSRVQLTADLNALQRGGKIGGVTLPTPPASMNKLIAAAKTKWVTSDNSAGTILRMKPELTGFEKTLRQLDTLSPELLSMTEELLNEKVQRGGTPRELAAIGRLMMLTQRLSRSASEFLTSGGIRSETAFQLGRDTTTFRTTVEGFLNGNETMQLAATRDAELRIKLELIKSKFDTYQKLVASILDNLPKFTAAKGAEQSIFYENEEVKALLTKVQVGFRTEQDSNNVWFWVMALATMFTLAVGVSIARVMLQDSRTRARGADARRQEAESMRQLAQSKEEEAKATNDQNQAAILRLMNELQEVADGDLTVHATVSEDITGAIADSVNYTVEELRGLVERVTTTAEQVTSASTNAQNISTDLLAATEQQSREIQEASETVLKMANEITDVSKSANESAEVARQSVAAALQGSTAVENSIKGMHEIREQIQETSKRIKRLGESSQEIGEITELISDITEQTNVLALNAAIQAASAGEAGRGFSVVAEEVQRLAERSAEAAKQIGALVRTIQTDTHDAVAAMEKSTQGVVEGARLSDAAGAALSDISRVSNRLAELIQGISFATELQATSANDVAHNIQHILSVTENTQDGTQQTAQSIRQLSLLAQELKNSVSRFRVVA
ncbi:methyl-accepting chemotaxis protein [Massilia antarctica]|uniref:methyl-accepting chemotaxis protein n=1 Tax=Massilia antarctica TaxID=2765360 RepID=UPI0006BB94F7|nr:methyl-accepting chemotaxis protein [Massilia sp. H27-R4]MCY0913571.1 methyl-accepting chemotaxis protein [Massilia sp. H27-R4]CUI09720.1 twitching motility protein PilJ [Janthinobacterium sp. CG23_2]CUU33506.1 twitching motility protein PilJ [Janthinobacterium sp. CG23_2]